MNMDLLLPAAALLVLILGVVGFLLWRQAQARQQRRILDSFAREVNANREDGGALSWYADTFYCRWEPSTKERPAELRVSVVAGLPASEFLARGRNGEVDAFGKNGANLSPVRSSDRIGYSVFSRDPSYVEHLMALGLSRRLAAGQDISYRIDPAGLVVIRKAFSSPSTGWSLKTFRDAQASGLRLAQLVSARPA